MRRRRTALPPASCATPMPLLEEPQPDAAGFLAPIGEDDGIGKLRACTRRPRGSPERRRSCLEDGIDGYETSRPEGRTGRAKIVL